MLLVAFCTDADDDGAKSRFNPDFIFLYFKLSRNVNTSFLLWFEIFAASNHLKVRTGSESFIPCSIIFYINVQI